MDFGKKKRIRNFTLMKYKKNGVPYVKCSDISETWSVEFISAHRMAGMIQMLVDKDEDAVLENLLTIWFSATTILDAQFSKDVLDAVMSAMRRVEVKTENDKDDLDVVRAYEEIGEQIVEQQEKEDE